MTSLLLTTSIISYLYESALVNVSLNMEIEEQVSGVLKSVIRLKMLLRSQIQVLKPGVFIILFK